MYQHISITIGPCERRLQEPFLYFDIILGAFNHIPCDRI